MQKNENFAIKLEKIRSFRNFQFINFSKFIANQLIWNVKAKIFRQDRKLDDIITWDYQRKLHAKSVKTQLTSERATSSDMQIIM